MASLRSAARVTRAAQALELGFRCRHNWPMPECLHTFFPLSPGRAHEAQGSGAAFFALAACANQPKPSLWINESWQAERLHPAGITPILSPDHLLFANTQNQADSLAAAEEALRSAAFSVVVTQLSQPLTLFTGRRLQLAAKAGETTGIFLIPEGAGSHAAETRWHCAPHFSPDDSTLHRWKLIKNKSGTLTEWVTRWDEQTRGIIVVSEAAERAGAARPPD